MTVIKPLEKKLDQSALFKLLFLVALISTGILLDKIFAKQKAEIPSILGKSQEIKLPTQEKIVEQIQGNDIVKNSIKKVEDIGGVVLGEATDTLTKLTSDAGSLVSNVVYDNTIGKVVEQIVKLPQDQQQKIREQICK
jgi:hypothetical protein